MYIIAFLSGPGYFALFCRVRLFFAGSGKIAPRSYYTGSGKITGCFLRPDIKRFCLTFTIGPDRNWFCLIQVPDTRYPRIKSKI